MIRITTRIKRNHRTYDRAYANKSTLFDYTYSADHIGNGGLTEFRGPMLFPPQGGGRTCAPSAAHRDFKEHVQKSFELRTDKLEKFI